MAMHDAIINSNTKKTIANEHFTIGNYNMCRCVCAYMMPDGDENQYIKCLLEYHHGGYSQRAKCPSAYARSKAFVV